MGFSSIKQWYRDLPLSGKLNLLIVFSVVIPLVLLVGLYTSLARGLMIDSAIESEERNLNYVLGNLESLYHHADVMSRIIVTDSYLQAVASRQRPWDESVQFDDQFRVRIILDRVVQRQDTVRSVYVRLNDGRVFGSGQIDVSRLVGDADELDRLAPILDSPLQAPVLLPTRPTRYEVGHDVAHSLALVRGFISVETGAVVGQIVISVGERTIRDILVGEGSATVFPSFLIDGSRQVIAASAASSLYESIEQIVSPAPVSDRGTDERMVRYRGGIHVVIEQELPGMQWSLVRLAPLAEILEPTRYVNVIVLLIGLVCLVIAVLLSIPITLSVTHPVRHLMDAMDLAGQGDLEVRVDATSRDEIGKMTEYFNRMVEQISDLMAEVYQEQRDKRRFELMALQAQIRPHFLYNALDGVCALVQMGQNEGAFTMAKALSLFYRGALSGGRNVISLGEELDIVEQYMTIQSLRYAGSFTYEVDVPEHLRGRAALKLSLQPLVENSIYHGFRGTETVGRIVIRAEDHGEAYEITVMDNGQGGIERPESGFGLASVRERVRLYFGPESAVVFDGTPGNTTVRLRLPAPRADHG